MRIQLYVIGCKNRDQLKVWLDSNGISTGIHYPIPIHLLDAYKDLNYKKEDFKITERCVIKILSLSMFPELKKEEIDYVVKMIRKFTYKL